MAEIAAVTFDYWNTLVHEDPFHMRDLRQTRWLGLLEDAGFAVDWAQLVAAFESSWVRYVERWHADEQYRAVDAAEHVLEVLGLTVRDDVRALLHEAFVDMELRAQLRLAPGIEECLAALSGAGIRIGIVCDVGMTPSVQLRRHLERHGILDRFDHWSFSDEVGRYKPSPVIFEHALAGLGGIAPAAAAHVGDLRRTDIAGAKAMGMTAVRYLGISDDNSQLEPEGDIVLTDHRNLPALLGISPAP